MPYAGADGFKGADNNYLPRVPDYSLDVQPLPCPFCGSDDVDAAAGMDTQRRVMAGCMTCGALGPDPEEGRGTKADAVERWNRAIRKGGQEPELEKAARELVEKTTGSRAFQEMHRGYLRMKSLPPGDERWDLADRLPDDVRVPYRLFMGLVESLGES